MGKSKTEGSRKYCRKMYTDRGVIWREKGIIWNEQVKVNGWNILRERERGSRISRGHTDKMKEIVVANNIYYKIRSLGVLMSEYKGIIGKLDLEPSLNICSTWS